MEDENYSKDFKNLNLKEENLDNKNFENCSFENCSFLGTSMKGTSFIDCTFKECKISLIKIDSSTKIQDVEFLDSKIVGVMFSKCSGFTTSFSFSQCHLKHCDFSEMKLNSTKFIKCMIEGCDFINTELKKSNFNHSKFTDTTIQGCNLTESNFLHATDFIINPAENKMFRAKFSATELEGLVKTFGIKVE